MLVKKITHSRFRKNRISHVFAGSAPGCVAINENIFILMECLFFYYFKSYSAVKKNALVLTKQQTGNAKENEQDAFQFIHHCHFVFNSVSVMDVSVIFD